MDPNVYALTHDTANPANSIIGAVELILNGGTTPEQTTLLLKAMSQKAKDINSAVDVYYKSIIKTNTNEKSV